MANPCQSLCADIYRRHIYAPDGRMVAEYTGGTITRYRAEYFHQDHLGNTRLVFSDFNQNGIVDLEDDDPATPLNELEITQESHYYPFGMNHLGPWYETVAPENKYLYNGKELNTDYDIKLMDYGARWYDGAIGRWTAVDPLSESTLSWAPYSYGFNNPIRFIDFMGLTPVYDWEAHKSGKKGIYRDEAGSELDWGQAHSQIQSEYNLPEVFYANVANVGTKKLTSIFNYATDIFSKNGFSGLSFTQVSVDEAKKHKETYEYQMFLAIRSFGDRDFPLDPGNSRVQSNGRIGVYDEAMQKESQKWLSYINLNSSSISGHRNPSYSAGYTVAHEALHQLLGIASYYLEGDGRARYHHHSDGDYGPNLNRSGHLTTIPDAPKESLQPAERILPHHSTYLRKFLLHK